jgi:hypothetical protein
MRQQQKKNRMRGRGRKAPNPMSRNYESNGPDVKIRGNPAHIAEKYTALARDALSSGDIVMAENYLQHAEHYNRIIAAAQAMNVRGDENGPMHGRGPQPAFDSFRDDDDDQPDTGDEDEGDYGSQRQPHVQAQPQPQASQSAPQANPQGGAQGGSQGSGEEPRGNREFRNRRDQRPRRRPRSEDGQNGAEINSAPREPRGEGRPERAERGERPERAERADRSGMSADAAMLPESLFGSPAARGAEE